MSSIGGNNTFALTTPDGLICFFYKCKLHLPTFNKQTGMFGAVYWETQNKKEYKWEYKNEYNVTGTDLCTLHFSTQTKQNSYQYTNSTASTLCPMLDESNPKDVKISVVVYPMEITISQNADEIIMTYWENQTYSGIPYQLTEQNIRSGEYAVHIKQHVQYKAYIRWELWKSNVTGTAFFSDYKNKSNPRYIPVLYNRTQLQKASGAMLDVTLPDIAFKEPVLVALKDYRGMGLWSAITKDGKSINVYMQPSFPGRANPIDPYVWAYPVELTKTPVFVNQEN